MPAFPEFKKTGLAHKWIKDQFHVSKMAVSINVKKNFLL